MTTYISNDGKDNLLSEQYLMQKFKEICPDVNPDVLDPDLFEDIMKNIIRDEYDKSSNIKEQAGQAGQASQADQAGQAGQAGQADQVDQAGQADQASQGEQGEQAGQAGQGEQADQEERSVQSEISKLIERQIIEENFIMADEIIPEMFVPSQLIYLQGKINNVSVNIMIDTGASICFTYKSVIERCGVGHLIDKSSKKMIEGVHGMKQSLGTIWFLDIELCVGLTNEDKDKDKLNYVSLPIMVDVNDDYEQNKINNLITDEKIKIIKEIAEANDKLLESDKINQICVDVKKSSSDNKLELVLGINFLKSYGANIDFSTMEMTLNKTIKIKFK